MIAEGSRPGIKPKRLETVVVRILHVLFVISRGAFDQRCSIQHANPTLAQTFRLSDHLAIIVGVQAVATPVPWHDKDDVPNVGSGGQLDKVVERRKMRIHPIIEDGVRRFTPLLGVACPLLLDPVAVDEAVLAENVVPGVGNDHNSWARGSPPLQRVQRLLDTLKDVRQALSPTEAMPHLLFTTWKKVRAFLEILPDVAPGGRVVVLDVNQCHGRVPGEDVVDLEFPRANHAAERKGANSLQKTGVFWAHILEIPGCNHLSRGLVCKGSQIRNHITFMDDPALSNRGKNVVQHLLPGLPVLSHGIVGATGRRFPGSKVASISSCCVVSLLHLSLRKTTVVCHDFEMRV